METLQTLGIALGFATVAGLNLYLTVFASGLAIQMGWVDVARTYPQLEVLGHPVIIAMAGILYFLQFFADKVPWVDTLWDAVHTIIRPLGGAFLAVCALGQTDPAFEVVAALLAGSVTLMAHGAKAGTRFVVNHSPEPFSNAALSIGEDLFVMGGLALVAYDPVLALIVFSIFLLTILWFAPRIFRAARAIWSLVWARLAAFVTPRSDRLADEMPSDLRARIKAENPQLGAIRWAIPCLSGRSRRIPGHLPGYLVQTDAEPDAVRFVAKRGLGLLTEKIDIAGREVGVDRKLLGDQLAIYAEEGKAVARFFFDACRRGRGEAIIASLGRAEAKAAA